MMSTTIALTREQLFERVWSKPVREVAVELGISDVGLAKACRRSGIPLPPQGYWISRRSRRNPRSKPSLPPARAGQRLRFEFHPRAVESRPEDSAEREKLQQRLTTLTNVDALRAPIERFVKAARGAISKRVDERGIIVANTKLPWPVRTSPALADRALNVFAGLLARIHGLGYEICADKERPDMPVLVILGQRYWVWIEEHSRRSERVLTAKELAEKKAAEKERRYFYVRDRWIYTPSGRLNLKLDHAGWYSYPRKQWGERGRMQLEDRLDEVVIDIVQFAAYEKEKAELEAKRQAEHEARVMRERERLQRLAHERLKRAALFREVHAWQKAQRLYRYIKTVEAAPLGVLSHFETEVARARWIAWARAIAAELDPLQRGSVGEMPPPPALPELPWGYRLPIA